MRKPAAVGKAISTTILGAEADGTMARFPRPLDPISRPTTYQVTNVTIKKKAIAATWAISQQALAFASEQLAKKYRSQNLDRKYR